MSTVPYQDDDLNVPAGDSFHISLMLFPALLVTVLASDVLYWVAGASFYARASEWALAAGLASGVFSAAEWLIRYIAAGSIRPSRACWIHVTGKLLAMLLTAANLIYRLNDDAPRAIVPTGIALTAIVLGLLIATAYLGRAFASEAPAEGCDDWDLV